MVSIASCKLAETAVAGVPIAPYVQFRKSEITVGPEEVPEEGAATDRYQARYRWYRSLVGRDRQVCWVHPDREAGIQCILCLRSGADVRKSYHCSSECLRAHWQAHRELHEARRLNGQSENGFISLNAVRTSSSTFSNGGETWQEVGRSRTFTPNAEDVGATLRCEVAVLDTATGRELARATCQPASRVRPLPQLPLRRLVPVHAKQLQQAGRFTALTYNLLADLYASGDAFPSCKAWELNWHYRRQNLLRELLAYGADVLCLQEVQSNHYYDFLAPELQKAGYTAIYKKKTAELYTGSSYAIDGCATFFRKDRFSMVKKYEVEFNKAAMSLCDAMTNPEQKKMALNRLLKDNVALIAVLESADDRLVQPSGRRQLVCVANTHIHANPELNDVKLWQVHTLLKGLEKIAASADIPMLVLGDFNSVPDSAAHQLLVDKQVAATHPELAGDPLNILSPHTKLQHTLPLASAYAAVLESRDNSPAAQKQRRQMSAKHREPKFTNMGREFTGTLDYILYTTDSLLPTATLELPDASEVRDARRPNMGLPNEIWSSDHIALMAEFQLVKR